jgi:hypothetical protein
MAYNARLFILVLLSALALGAASAASASASEYLIEGKQVTEATNTEGTSGLSLLTGKVGGAEVKLECAKDTFTGTVEAAGKSTATLLLKECAETKPASCKVPATIEGKLKDKLIGSLAPEDEFEATKAEGTIAEIAVSGAGCAITGTYALKGTQVCELPKVEEELTEHEIVCKKTGSKLKLGSETASFSSTEKAKLTSGKKWDATGLGAAKLLSVDFRGNQPLLVDHLKNTAYHELEKALSTKEYGALNEVEWEADHTGAIKKIWIPVYVLGEKIKLEAQFSVEQATRESLEKDGEEVDLKGLTTIAGSLISFLLKLNNAEIKLQLTDHSGYLTTGEVGASANLAKKVTGSLATITWEWSVKESGHANPIVQGLGDNTNTYYTIYNAPVNGALIYLTLLDAATEGIGKLSEPVGESGLVAGVWTSFSNRQEEASCLTLVCGIFRIRTYNPATGELKKDGNPLLYYESLKTGLTGAEYRGSTFPSGRFRVWQLLEALTGECGAWARAFRNSLAIEGVKSLQLRIFPKFPPPSSLPCQAEGACSFYVKTWSFAGADSHPPLTLFPYLLSQVTDENGATGQGVENPDSDFDNHQLVEVGNRLYDPSYASAPVGAGNTGETAFNLGLYQEKNISGFCQKISSTYYCALPVAGRQGLAAAVEDPGAITESEETEFELQQAK